MLTFVTLFHSLAAIVYEPKRPTERYPFRPGALLEDIIPATGKSKVEIANLLGIPRHCRAPWKAVWRRPAIWLRMQAAYDAWHAEREVDVSGYQRSRPLKLFHIRESPAHGRAVLCVFLQ